MCFFYPYLCRVETKTRPEIEKRTVIAMTRREAGIKRGIEIARERGRRMER